MDLDKADVVRVGIPLLHLVHRIVVEHAKLHIISSGNNILLSDNELGTSDGVCSGLEGLHHVLQER